MSAATFSPLVVWHDVECGGYRADLPLWRELARAEAGPVLDVGAGTGRVALDLARAGHAVTALDREPELLDALRARAAGDGRCETVVADARGFSLRAPLRARASCRCRRSSCCPSAPASSPRRAATSCPAACSRSRSPTGWRTSASSRDELLPIPDVGAVGGWRFASQPTAVRALPAATRIERVRRAVGPDGGVQRAGRRDRARAPQRRAARGRGPRRRLRARAGAARSPRPRTTSAPRWCCCVPERTLRVCALYPDLMNIYADRGNLTVFERRCAWRGLGFELSGAGIGDAIDPEAHDLFYIGGGQDRDQALCARDLASVKRDALHAAAGRGAVVFAVCGGLQLLGDGYELGDERLPGRRPGRPRHAPRGRSAADRQHRDRARPRPAGRATLAGFENHAGRTYLGAGRRAARPRAARQRQQRRRRHRGRPRRAARDRDRHLPARPAAAEEHLASPTG